VPVGLGGTRERVSCLGFRHLRFATPAGVAPEDCRELSGKAAGDMSAMVGPELGVSGILGLRRPPVRRPRIAFRQHSCYARRCGGPKIAADCG
jgi:hypothetical protein